MTRGFCKYASIVEKVEVHLGVEMQSPAFAWVIKAVLKNDLWDRQVDAQFVV